LLFVFSFLNILSLVDTKKRVIKDKEKKRFNKKFEDITKMDFEWKDNEKTVEEQPIQVVVKRDVISADSFEELDIDNRLKEVLSKNGYSQMTKIQKTSIPVILASN